MVEEMRYYLIVKWGIMGIIYQLKPSTIKMRRRNKWCKALFEFIDNQNDDHLYWHKAQWYAQTMGMI